MEPRRRLAFVVAAAASIALSSAVAAAAHPLGNFTVNVSSALVVRTDEVAIGYVVDMAEIPAFRERRAIDTDRDGAVDPSESVTYANVACSRSADELELTVGGTTVPIASRGEPVLTFPPGAGGLTTLRLECALVGSLEGRPIPEGGRVDVAFVDGTHPDSIGWREVSAAGDGVTIVGSDVPMASETDGLRSYPSDELPPDVRAATLSVEGGGPALASDLATEGGEASAPMSRSNDGGILGALLVRADLTPALVALMVVAALGVGALHALGPGHGKTLIGAYLVGGAGTIRHAFGVGAAVSLMHTVSVLGLGGVVLAAERLVAPERVYPWLGVTAGGIAIALGAALLRARLRVFRGASSEPHGHPHQPGHHHHPHREHDDGAAAISSRGLVALAFSGGALPSPTALVVFLGAVSIGRAALGLTLIAAFSLGLAGALVGVGVLALRARDVAERRLSARAMRLVPVGSAVAIVGMGLFLAARGAAQL